MNLGRSDMRYYLTAQSSGKASETQPTQAQTGLSRQRDHEKDIDQVQHLFWLKIVQTLIKIKTHDRFFITF